MDNYGDITDAVFNFSATTSNPMVPSGSFKMIGSYDKNKNVISLKGIEWIKQPFGYIMVDIVGNIDMNKNEFNGNIVGSGLFNLKKKD